MFPQCLNPPPPTFRFPIWWNGATCPSRLLCALLTKVGHVTRTTRPHPLSRWVTPTIQCFSLSLSLSLWAFMSKFKCLPACFRSKTSKQNSYSYRKTVHRLYIDWRTLRARSTVAPYRSDLILNYLGSDVQGVDKCTLPSLLHAREVQGSTIRPFPGYENAVGNLRQK